MTPAERKVLRSYGDWTNFCHSFGLKPYDLSAQEEGMAMFRSFAADDEREEGGKRK
jgi:hypothetical protein